MYELNIGKTILRLRKQKEITQEQLSGMIGVTAGAVSKWETGNSTPDIALLSPLARALDTSLNELLSFHEELLEAEVTQIHQELVEIFLHNGFYEGEAKCKEYLNKYPNSFELKFIVAGLINMYSMLLGEDYERLVKEKSQFALSLLYQVAESKHIKYSQSALFLIGQIQMSMENYEESERCLKKLSEAFVDPMILYASLLQEQHKYKEAEKLCTSMLLQYLNHSTAMMSFLSNISRHNNNFDKSVLYLEAINKVQSTFKIGLCSGAYSFCRMYIDEGEKELAAEWFNKYVDGLLSTEYDYTNNPYFEELKLQINPEGQAIIRKKLLQTLVNQAELKALEGIPKYEQAIDKLKVSI